MHFHFTLTPALDLMLSVICMYYGLRLVQRGIDMMAVGYLMISGAAFTGVFHLGGLMEFRWIHDFLSAMSQLVGTVAIGLGILAAVMRQRDQRYGAYSLAVFGPVAMYYFYEIERGPLVGLSIWAGTVFLTGWLSLAWQLILAKKLRYVVIGFAALAIAACGALMEGRISPISLLHPVDYLHIALMIALTTIYHVVTLSRE